MIIHFPASFNKEQTYILVYFLSTDSMPPCDQSNNPCNWCKQAFLTIENIAFVPLQEQPPAFPVWSLDKCGLYVKNIFVLWLS